MMCAVNMNNSNAVAMTTSNLKWLNMAILHSSRCPVGGSDDGVVLDCQHCYDFALESHIYEIGRMPDCIDFG